jgi:hypothetical protein
MFFRPQPRFGILFPATLAIAYFALTSGGAAQTSPGEPSSRWDLTDLLDQLPDLRRFDMPQFRDERIRLYVQPHFGDFLHRDYLRLPVGVRVKPDERMEFITELESYFTHGLRDPAGYGLSRLRLGAKEEQVLDENHPLGWSLGVDYYTPLSRPPRELSDGFRHTNPYFALTHQVVPAWHLIGYASLGADLIDHTPLEPNFGRNQLHGNSTSLALGVTRRWKHFRTALTTTWSTTALLSDENHNVYAIRPDILIPLNVREGYHTRLLLTLGTRAIWGPDGFETGVSSSVRVEFSTYAGGRELP